MARLAKIGLAVWLCCRAWPAYANVESTAEKPASLVVEGRAGRIHIKVHPQVPTILVFMDSSRAVDRTKWQGFDFNPRVGDVIILHPQVQKIGLWGVFRVSTSRYETAVVVEGVAREEDATDIREIRHRSDIEATERMIQARVALREKEVRDELAQQHAAEIAEKDKQIDALSQQVAATTLNNSALGILTAVLEKPSELPPVDNPRKDDKSALVVTGLAWQQCGNLAVALLDLLNPRSRDFDVGEMQLFDENGVKNRASEVIIAGGGETPRSADPNRPVIGTVPAGQHVRAAILVREPENIGPHVTLAMREADGDTPPVKQNMPTFWFKEPPTEREKRAKQTVLGPAGSIGACWFKMPGEAMSDAMMCTGLGLRFTKGLTEMLAFNVEGLGMWTGDSETLSAKLGRATASGLLRFGIDKTIPYFRVGIGAQGTSYTVSAGGPDTSFEFASFWTFGAGYDMRFGDLLIGAQVVGEAGMQDDKLFQNALSIGVHLGYGWNTGGSDK